MRKINKEHLAVFGYQKNCEGVAFKLIEECFPEKSRKKIRIFSNAVLEQYLEEEYRHGTSDLSAGKDSRLLSSSSGERRKALMNHLLGERPDVLVLEDTFDCLDLTSVKNLRDKLQHIASKTSILQFIRRSDELLPFIEKVLVFENEKLHAEWKARELQKDRSRDPLIWKDLKIPSAPEPFENLPEVLIEMKGVSVHYEGRQVLKDINWTVRKGEFWKLSGPNGSGKTTLLSMIFGDNPKAYGQELYLFGNKKGSGENVWSIKKRIGYYTPGLAVHFKGYHTTEHMVISGLVDSIGLYQSATDQQKALARKWLEMLGLWEKREVIFRKIPLLEQRLVLIARAMIKHPPLLILDEPSTSLDEEHSSVINMLINLISRQTAVTIIYVSHREEPLLRPDLYYQLQVTEDGSVGKVGEGSRDL